MEEIKKKIFPIYIDDVYISYPSDLFILLRFKSINIDTSNISKKTIEYLIKHKKFMDSDIVYSMASESEIDFMRIAIKDILQSQIVGDIVQAGVWRGGMSIWMNYLIYNLFPGQNIEPRKLWLFDSYGEFPCPTYPRDKYVHPVTEILYENHATTEVVESNFEKFGIPTSNVYLVKGKFEDSIKNVDIPKISILHLDCDYYDSTLLMIEKYYPKITKGGYIIINNYYYEYIHAKIAVDEYRGKNNITNPVIKLGEKYGYWKV